MSGNPPQGTPAVDLAIAKIDLEVMALVEQGLSYAQIGARLGISKSGAFRSFKRGMAAIKEEIEARALRYLNRQLAEIESERHLIQEPLLADHLIVSNGIVVQRNGQPLPEYGPLLASVDRMAKLRDQEAKLLGLYAKTEVDHTGTLTIELVGIDPDAL